LNEALHFSKQNPVDVDVLPAGHRKPSRVRTRIHNAATYRSSANGSQALVHPRKSGQGQQAANVNVNANFNVARHTSPFIPGGRATSANSYFMRARSHPNTLTPSNHYRYSANGSQSKPLPNVHVLQRTSGHGRSTIANVQLTSGPTAQKATVKHNVPETLVVSSHEYHNDVYITVSSPEKVLARLVRKSTSKGMQFEKYEYDAPMKVVSTAEFKKVYSITEYDYVFVYWHRQNNPICVTLSTRSGLDFNAFLMPNEFTLERFDNDMLYLKSDGHVTTIPRTSFWIMNPSNLQGRTLMLVHPRTQKQGQVFYDVLDKTRKVKRTIAVTPSRIGILTSDAAGPAAPTRGVGTSHLLTSHAK
jgi:hypothetical protein